MTLLTKFGIGLGSYIGLNLLERIILLSNSMNKNNKLTEPRLTSIIMPAYNEEKYIGRAINSIMEQNIIQEYPEFFEIIVVVYSGSDDRTIDVVKQFPVRVKVQDKRGKLYANDMGIRDSKGEIVVLTDADSFYPPNWLNILIDTFNKDNDVVGVNGLMFNDGLAGLLLMNSSQWRPMPFMLGCNSAFLKEYYPEVKWNLDIDQLSLQEMLKEEEYRLGERLSKFGKVVHNWNASAFTSSRRLVGFQDLQFTKEVVNKQRFGEMIVNRGW